MPRETEIECSFLVPDRRDPKHSDGQPHADQTWTWLDDQLLARFGRRTIAPGWYEGIYQDLDNGQRVADRSRKFIVALGPAQIEQLRELLLEVGDRFGQQCIYLTVAGATQCIGATTQ